MSFGSSLTLIILCLSIGIASAAESYNRHCFEQHIRDAIKLNRQRRATYKEWGGFRAGMLSRQLVLLEKLILPSAKKFDRQAIRWQEKGIPFLCHDLIDMKLTPLMPDNPIPNVQPYESMPRRNVGAVLKETRRLIDHQDWNKAFMVLEQEIEQLHRQPQYHCLERHFIESVQRTIHLAPSYLGTLENEIDKLELTELLQKYLRYQLLGLRLARILDQMAAPLQQQGIPIFCNDVPPILTRPAGY